MTLDCVDSLCDILASAAGPLIVREACAAHRILVRRYGRTKQTRMLADYIAMVIFR